MALAEEAWEAKRDGAKVDMIRVWVFEYLFAKQDKANIEDDELAQFRRLVSAYAALTAYQVNQLIRENDWTEICDGDPT